MATVQSIPISGHVESTIYRRGGRDWISLDGKEWGVYEYRPGSSTVPIKVVQRNQLYYTIQGVPTTGAYTGNEIMERISHDIAVFYTQLSSIIESLRFSPEFDVNTLFSLSDMVVELAHACGGEIEKERSNARTFLLDDEILKYEANHLNQELTAHKYAMIKLETKSNALTKALKCVLNRSADDPPLLHQLCKDKEVSVSDLIMEFDLDLHEHAEDHLLGIKSATHETQLLPIHVAALSGNASVMKELYDLAPGISEEITGDKELSVLELSAYGSSECFELAKSWLKPTESIMPGDQLLESRSRLLIMAAQGGNSKVLSSLISSPQSFSATKYGDFWKSLFACAFSGGNLDCLNWLEDFEDANELYLDSVLSALRSTSANFLDLECFEWAINGGLPSEVLFDSFPTFQHELAKYSRVDVLEIISCFPEFNLTARGEHGFTLMHSACLTDSVEVLEWAFQHSSSKQDDFNLLDEKDEHMVHIAAEYASLKCLKWICEHIHKFRLARGSRHLLALPGANNRTVLHCAARSGDMSTLEWFHSVHGADFENVEYLDKEGSIPLQIPSKTQKALDFVLKYFLSEKYT